VRWTLLTIATAACGGTATSAAPDARPDADTTVSECFQERGCEHGRALDVPSTEVPNDLWTTTFCEDYFSRPCAAGCAVESVGPGTDLGNQIDPVIFCAETPDAQAGDSCALGCLPTRASVDANGVVTQAYLACDQTAGRCAAAPPPTVATWMQPCPKTAAGRGPGANGRASADQDGGDQCLIAWDATTSTIASGQTIACLGDWECPAGAMCDDHVPAVDGEGGGAVCRPGARGTPIDPTALHP
jgi:hypothetical protein